jgi:imidazole glycerol-phosphate synthase subunit HisH
MLRVTIADYGVGNLHSLRRALERCGADVTVTSDMGKLSDAECIAFPGVGAFDRVMETLLPYRETITERLSSGVPCLGICIGMQILMEGSDEGELPGLGLISGRVEKLKAKQIPQMGWNTVVSDDSMFEGIDNRFFYFTHSYYGNPTDKDAVKGYCEYEGVNYPIFFRKKNIVGSQFHPEKSSASGMKFLKNFIQFAEESK